MIAALRGGARPARRRHRHARRRPRGPRQGLLRGARPQGDARASGRRLAARALRRVQPDDAEATRLPQPVIARVHGIATAAGCQLVSMAISPWPRTTRASRSPASTSASSARRPAVGVGRNVARKRVMEMLLTGELIDAPTALAWGLVNRVVPAAELDAAVAALRRHHPRPQPERGRARQAGVLRPDRARARRRLRRDAARRWPATCWSPTPPRASTPSSRSGQPRWQD